MKKMNVAIIGYGRSGCDIHSSVFRNCVDFVNVVAVVELDDNRAQAAKEHFNCDTYSDYKELFGRKDIDLVVNASYSHMHYSISLDLINHGFNVLCEKPVAKTAAQVQELADAAKKNGVLFTIYQQSGLASYFVRMQEIIDSGILGNIKLVRAHWSGFNRRYDWQTVQKFDAGAMRNTGPHPFEQIMRLAGTDEMPKIYSKLEIFNSVGDAEDYVFAILEYPDKPRFEIEINPSDPYTDGYIYQVYGDRGALRLSHSKIEYQYYKDEESPQPVLDMNSLHKEDGSPAYCSDVINWHRVTEDIEPNVFTGAVAMYYRRLYDHMYNGAELYITPEHIKTEIAIFEEIERQNPLKQTIF